MLDQITSNILEDEKSEGVSQLVVFDSLQPHGL